MEFHLKKLKFYYFRFSNNKYTLYNFPFVTFSKTYQFREKRYSWLHERSIRFQFPFEKNFDNEYNSSKIADTSLPQLDRDVFHSDIVLRGTIYKNNFNKKIPSQW